MFSLQMLSSEYLFCRMIENDISYIIRGCIFNVYNNLGPGLLESAYTATMVYELNKMKLAIRTEVALPMIYESINVNIGYRLDILVENKVIIEVESGEPLLSVHHKKLITYLKLSGFKLGLLVNFNSDDISKKYFQENKWSGLAISHRCRKIKETQI